MLDSSGEEIQFDYCDINHNFFDLCIWLDERDPSNKRFHMTADFVCETTLLGGMILNAK